jgi:hypothetical protein
MAGGGGQSGGFESYLPIAAALAATVMTDGAAAPYLVEELGATGAAAATGAGIGALTGGGVAALTGQDVGRNALMGGIGGAGIGASGLYQGAEGVAAAGGSFTGAASTLGTTPGALASGYAGMTPVEIASSINAVPAGETAGLFSTLGNGITGTQAMYGAAGLGTLGLMAQDKSKYGIPPNSAVNWNGGSLADFRYDPQHYNPDTVTPPNPHYQAQYQNRVTQPTPASAGAGYPQVYQPTMAEGGMVPGYADGGLLDPNSEPVDFMGGDMYPQSQQQRSYYATPTQMPTSAQQTAASYEPNTNPLTGEMTANMAGGGLASLGSYSDGGQMLRGPGDGMSDSIPARIGSRQPARLADNEFVVPADVVSHLGNGSSDAGAKKLYSMMAQVRKARTGKKNQAPKINADKYLPA